MPKRLQFYIIAIAILSGCTLDDIERYGSACPQLSYIKDPTCTVESCSIGDYAQNFKSNMCPSDVPECTRDENGLFYCATIKCEDAHHIYNGQCEPDDLENCGQHAFKCADEATGWLNGICQNGKCHATECIAGYEPNAGKCEASECPPGEHPYRGICEEDDTNNCGQHSQACQGIISGWMDGECRNGKCYATACDDLRGYVVSDGNCRARTGCEAGLHYYNGQCEQDDLNNCGSHGNKCSDQPGWVSGTCDMVNNQQECSNDEDCSGGVCMENECFKTECVASECESIYEITAGKCVPRTNCDPGEHLYQNQCEPDSVDNCGEHNKQCKNVIRGWETGTCTEQTCIPSSCLTGYHLSEGTCVQDSSTACGEPPVSCALGQLCSNGSCNDDCDPGLIRCIQSDQTFVCIDPQTDNTYCGANTQCQNYTTCGTGQDCKEGLCTQTSCANNQETICTVDQTPLCVNLYTDAQHCGSCNHKCSEYPQTHATSNACSSKKCQYECEAGYTNCGTAEATYCILNANFNSDSNNCGGCGVKCNPSNNEVCKNGACVISNCQKSCLDEINNECVNTPTQCGTGCTNCSALPNVSSATCDSSGNCHINSCNANAHIYNNTCEPDSPWNCGEHDHACSAIAGWADGNCTGGQCKASECKNGYHLYNNTCEEDNNTNCGSHGNKCQNGETCQNGTCKCPEGYTNITYNKTSVKAACISSKDDFLNFRNAINAGKQWPTGNSDKYYVLTRNIDLGTQSNWVGVGTSSYPFSGVFVGSNQTISGLLTCKANNCGIFGFTNTRGTEFVSIQDLRSSVTINSSYDYVGSIIGNGNYMTLYNCSSSGSITGKSYVGGIAGSVMPGQTVKDCSSSSTITATGENVGGIVGSIAGYSIQNCTYSGTLTANGGNAGGIVGSGHTGGSIINSLSSGSIKGSANGHNYGGLIGKAEVGDIQNSSSTSNVSNGKTCGGLVGSGSNNYTIRDSYYNGTVNCSEYVGGLIGEAGSDVKIYTSGAFGSIPGSSAGGLIGYIGSKTTDVTINNNFAVTTLSGKPKGGLIGKSEATSSTGSNIDCNWVGSTFKTESSNSGAVCTGNASFTKKKPVFVYEPTYNSASNKNLADEASVFTLSKKKPVVNGTDMLNGLKTNCSNGNWQSKSCALSVGLEGAGTYTLPMPGITPSNCK